MAGDLPGLRPDFGALWRDSAPYWCTPVFPTHHPKTINQLFLLK
jgi:hypothetical protein